MKHRHLANPIAKLLTALLHEACLATSPTSKLLTALQSEKLTKSANSHMNSLISINQTCQN